MFSFSYVELKKDNWRFQTLNYKPEIIVLALKNIWWSEEQFC